MAQLSKEVLKRCLNCKYLKSRHRVLVCRAGRSPETCRRVKRRPSKSQPSKKKPIREVVLRGDEEVD